MADRCGAGRMASVGFFAALGDRAVAPAALTDADGDTFAADLAVHDLLHLHRR
ncbi:MAG: hypothetical protein AAGI52_04725 [Bacteroidota bacterium]